MTVEFHSILTCIGMRCPGVDCHTAINGSALLVRQRSEDQLSVGCFPKRKAIIRRKDLPGNLGAVFTCQPQNANGTDLIASRYGGNGVGHNEAPLFHIAALAVAAHIGGAKHKHHGDSIDKVHILHENADQKTKRQNGHQIVKK